jgi:hypothetical protein
MTRSTLDNTETEGDFARGMGIAIGTFIALFAVCIALFVIEQSRAQTPRSSRAATPAATVAPPAHASPGQTAVGTQR